jgi:hypothetical protein
LHNIFTTTLAGYEIKLDQHGGSGEHFRVTYGAQTAAMLDYTRAANELGACLMHALRLEGKFKEEN